MLRVLNGRQQRVHVRKLAQHDILREQQRASLAGCARLNVFDALEVLHVRHADDATDDDASEESQRVVPDFAEKLLPV